MTNNTESSDQMKEAFIKAPRWFKDINDIFGNDGEIYLCFTNQELVNFINAEKEAEGRAVAHEIFIDSITEEDIDGDDKTNLNPRGGDMDRGFNIALEEIQSLRYHILISRYNLER